MSRFTLILSTLHIKMYLHFNFPGCIRNCCFFRRNFITDQRPSICTSISPDVFVFVLSQTKDRKNFITDQRPKTRLFFYPDQRNFITDQRNFITDPVVFFSGEILSQTKDQSPTNINSSFLRKLH